MSDRLTQIVPTPRRVPIGGANFFVWPATLRDLAELQSWLDDAEPEPLAEAWPLLFGPDALEGEPRWALLREVHAKADEGPPAWDDARGGERLATPEGVGVLVWMALRRGRPSLTAEEAVSLASSMTEAEYFAVRRAWLGTDPAHEAASLLMEGFARSGGGPSATWGQAVHETAEAFGWTYAYVYSLTLAEFANARRGGKPSEGPEFVVKPGDPEAYRAFNERRKGPAAA